MKAILCLTLASVTLCGVSQTQSEEKKATPARERLCGAWYLVSLGEQGPDGKVENVPGLKGTLVYTRDGRMSVQIMYPESAAALSNDYVMNGYEASFGSYDANEAAHTVTHHVQGSITRGLVGKDLTRMYQFSGNRLIIRSIRPDEHWLVTWEHY